MRPSLERKPRRMLCGAFGAGLLSVALFNATPVLADCGNYCPDCTFYYAYTPIEARIKSLWLPYEDVEIVYFCRQPANPPGVSTVEQWWGYISAAQGLTLYTSDDDLCQTVIKYPGFADSDPSCYGGCLGTAEPGGPWPPGCDCTCICREEWQPPGLCWGGPLIITWSGTVDLTTVGTYTLTVTVCNANAPTAPGECVFHDDPDYPSWADDPCVQDTLQVKVVEADVDIEGVPEEAEDTPPGGLVRLNDDDDNANSILDKDPSDVPVVGENDTKQASLHGWTPTNEALYQWQLSWTTGRIAVWRNQDKSGTPIVNGQWYTGTADFPSTLWIEGLVTSSQPGDVSLTLTITETYDATRSVTCSDSVAITVFRIDVRVDSNNDGHIGVADDPIEERTPGKILPTNADNDDFPQGDSHFDFDTAQPLPVPGEDDLVEVRLSVEPSPLPGEVTLTVPNNTKIWTSSTKAAIAGTHWAAPSVPQAVYIEGIEAGGGTLTLSYASQVDIAKITVVKVQFVVWLDYLDNWPMDACPNNGGRRFFPDAIAYFDPHPERRYRVTPKALIEPPIAGATVHFKVWDVDDPSADGNPVDHSPAAPPHAGPDNRGAGGIPQLFWAVTDSSGSAETGYDVSTRPGDNYRMFASCTLGAVAQMRQSQADDALAPIPPHVAQSEMLTIWRHLWLELDSMPNGQDSPVTSKNIDDTWANSPHAGESGAEINDFNPEDDGRYEGGTLTVAGGGTYTIIDHWDDSGDDTVYVNGNITVDEDRLASFSDDDNAPLPRPANYSLMNAKFNPAYIQVEAMDWSMNIGLFVANLPITADEAVLPARWVADGNTRPDFWLIQVYSCYQGIRSYDGDPDVWYHYHNATPTGHKLGDQSHLYGQTPPPGAGAYDNVCLIFLETIRDAATQEAWLFGLGVSPFQYTSGQIEQTTVTHEAGHVFGCVHEATGLMQAGTEDPQLSFSNASLDILRTSTSIGDPWD